MAISWHVMKGDDTESEHQGGIKLFFINEWNKKGRNSVPKVLIEKTLYKDII